MRRSALFMTLAAGIVASLALSTPSHAGTILTEATIFMTTGGDVDDLTVVYNVPITAGSFNLLPSSTVVLSAPISYTADSVTIDFTAVTAPPLQHLDYTLTSPSPGPYDDISSTFSGNYTSYVAGVTVSSATVPEPSSLALLGIGMAGFFVYRRLFKPAATV